MAFALSPSEPASLAMSRHGAFPAVTGLTVRRKRKTRVTQA